MILGVGTDIIEIKRIEKALANERFALKAFTTRELDYLSGKRPQSFAGSYAAKEAVAKALGSGFAGFGLMDVEILRNERGKPFAALGGGALAAATALGVTNLHLSISHCGEYATAYCLAEGAEKELSYEGSDKEADGRP